MEAEEDDEDEEEEDDDATLDMLARWFFVVWIKNSRIRSVSVYRMYSQYFVLVLGICTTS